MEYNRPKEVFAFYNVENLLLPDAPPVHKADPTNSGLRNWDTRKYRQKINKIAHVAELLVESEGVLPLLFGFSEIQGREPLSDLLKMPVFQNYNVVHYPSDDVRGIDVALFYDRQKIQVLSSKPLRYTEHSEGIPGTRDILYVRLKFQDLILNVYLLHLPSKKEKDANFLLRKRLLMHLASDLTQNFGDEAMVLMGDFNMNPDDELFSEIFGINFGKAVFNPFLDLYLENIYSTYHHKNGLLFDQMILSHHFRQSEFPLKLTSAKVFSHKKLRNAKGNFEHRPARTFAGTRYLGGFSDHFPVITVLN